MNDNESIRAVSDWVKKALSSGGVGLGDMRRDVTQLFLREFKNILSNATIEINAKIRFVPNETEKKKRPRKKKVVKKL